MSVVAFPFHAPPADMLIPEHHLLALRPVLSSGRLRKARASNTITWTKGKRGSAWYKLADVDQFITDEMERRCRGRDQASYLTSADNGSPESQNAETSTVTGLNAELESHVARHLEQQI